MLSLVISQGDYVTIGNDVVLQFNHMSSNRCNLVIQAPKEIPILRGEVLERTGEKRPDCVFESKRRRKAELPWNHSKEQALRAMRRQLDQMDGDDEHVKTLRRQLDHIFPPAEPSKGK